MHKLSKRLRYMQKNRKIVRVIRWVVLILLVVFLPQFFWPRHYNTSKRIKNLHHLYWQLPTGSTIGYTYLQSIPKSRNQYPIIYLHGGPGGAVSRRVIDDLKSLQYEGFDLYFYDQVGSGASSRLPDISEYTIYRHIDDLHEIIKKINSKKVILIGQSWGAILAAAYLSKYPEKIDKVIFTSPGPIYPINKTLIKMHAPDTLSLRMPSYSNKTANESATNLRIKLITFFATHFSKKITSDEEVDEYADFLDSKTYKSALCDTSLYLANRGGNGFFAGIMTYQSLLLMKDFRGKIKDVETPVLILKGQCDNQPWGATSEYVSLFPNHKFVLIPNAGHFINVEQQDMYIREIKAFLLK